jgi:hypothetical protein
MNEVPTPSPLPPLGSKWYAVTIADPELTSGASFSRLLTRTSKFVACPVVMIARLSIVPGVPPELKGTGDGWPILNVDVLRECAHSLTQFVEGRFFFFQNAEAADKLDKRDPLIDMVRQSELTITIADNTRYDIVTRSTALVCDLLTDEWSMDLAKDELARLFGRHRR